MAQRLAIEHATGLLASGSVKAESQQFPLGEKAGQCCGGAMTVFFETFFWRRPTNAIFGAGHVGQALGGLAPYLQANVIKCRL